MTKLELIKAVSEKVGQNATSVTKVFDAIISEIKAKVKDGEAVELRGFGTFAKKRRAERHARDLHRNVEVIVPAKDVPMFKASNKFFEI